MQGRTQSGVDERLLHEFETGIFAKSPHIEAGRVVNPTELVDLTELLRECATAEYGLDLSGKKFQVYGKLEASLVGGSVKSRAALQIAYDAIRSGKLRKGMTIFEATSGNFGIALGQLGGLGLDVVALVSRRLEQGVLEELERSGVKTVDLDIDVCPAPGVQVDPNTMLAKIVSGKMRERFSELGLDVRVFDAAKAEIEMALARQDVINLAKVLAKAYGGFCPEQYDNEDNVKAHATVTGPEIERQLGERGLDMADFLLVCAFGTGGTSGGLARFVESRFGGKKTVHVVYPPEGKDVAGIRTKSKALGLRFYEPKRYAGEHEVDFDQAKRLFAFLVNRGLDIGESSALALFAVLQMVNFGSGERFVVILADGSKKYTRMVESVVDQEEKEEGLEVTPEAAKSRPASYSAVVWTHMGYVPSDEGAKLIASALGRQEGSVRIADPGDVARLVTGQEVTPRLMKVLDGNDSPGEQKKRVLLVCMSGNTSLRAAQALEAKGIKAQSLYGGITRMAQSGGKPLPALVKPAR